MRRSKEVRKPRPKGHIPAYSEVENAVLRRFSHPFGMLKLRDAEGFFVELATPAERQAFASLYPEKFYSLFGFDDSEMLQFPSVAGHGYPFRRYEFMEFLEANPPQGPFNPPDLRGVPYRDHQLRLCEARAAWWQANDWPLTEEERKWIAR